MNSFESDVQIFESTLYGWEMKDSLSKCFRFLYNNIETYGEKIQEMKEKITSLEGGNQNGVYR